jgi:hypothetical protein
MRAPATTAAVRVRKGDRREFMGDMAPTTPKTNLRHG